MSISIIIPVYNGERYIEEAIQTVLEQTSSCIHEIFIIDDGSTDGTATVAKQFAQIQYLYQEHKGVARARNLGVESATGKWIAFLDADDLWDPTKIEKQHALLQKQDLDFVYCYTQQFQCPNSSQKNVKSKKIMPGYYASSFMGKKDAFERVGFFDEKLPIGEFIDWYSRSRALQMKEEMLDDILTYRRIHDTNMTVQKQKNFHQYAITLKKHLNRKRAVQ